MKILLSVFFTVASLSGVAQIHRIGLTGGINNINSWEAEEPPFGFGSPYDSKMGYSVNLSYSYIFSSNITLSIETASPL